MRYSRLHCCRPRAHKADAGVTLRLERIWCNFMTCRGRAVDKLRVTVVLQACTGSPCHVLMFIGVRVQCV